MNKQIVSNKGLALLLLVFCFVEGLYAQTATTEVAPESLRRRVSSIETFINRFNFTEDQVGNSTVYPEGVIPANGFIRDRNLLISSLIDLKVQKGANKIALVNEFLQQVNSTVNQSKLSLHDKQLFAEVQMDVLYKQMPRKLSLILQLDEPQPKSFRWVIRSVKANFFDIIPRERDNQKLIPPNSHGTDFIGLPQNFSDVKSIGQFVSPQAVTDQLSFFLYSVYNGELTLKKTRQIAFHFLQLDNWIVRVEEVEQSPATSGFLITELLKSDNIVKKEYALRELNIK